jgi:hypothetical protein
VACWVATRTRSPRTRHIHTCDRHSTYDPGLALICKHCRLARHRNDPWGSSNSLCTCCKWSLLLKCEIENNFLKIRVFFLLKINTFPSSNLDFRKIHLGISSPMSSPRPDTCRMHTPRRDPTNSYSSRLAWQCSRWICKRIHSNNRSLACRRRLRACCCGYFCVRSWPLDFSLIPQQIRLKRLKAHEHKRAINRYCFIIG